jgi:superoxide dismutase, Cu-Zn family
MSMLKIAVAGLSASTLAACASAGAPLRAAPPAANAHAVVMSSTCERVGTATLTQDAAGMVHVQMKVTGLPPGVHGVHIHAVGSCVAPSFASAGGHFNPGSKHHGMNNPSGPHAGDLPNMTVDASGNAEYDASTSRVSLTPGANSLFDADGSAVVIHAAADDNVSDPAGNAGARIACGEIKSGTA